jgi:uncharacterized protein (DUF58 family)
MSGWLRRLPRFVPTRRLALLVALTSPIWLLSSTSSGRTIIADLIAALVALALLDAIAMPGARDLVVIRELPPSVGLGDSVSGRYRVRLSWQRRGWLRAIGRRITATLSDDLPRGVRQASAPLSGHFAVGDGEAELPLQLEGRERGSWRLGDVALHVNGPLGLVARIVRTAPTDSIAVVPSMTGVRRYRLLAVQHRLHDVGIRSIRRRGEGSAFANLREYVRGDDPRHIDWKATARRGKLITREFTVEQGQTVFILVDAGRMMTQLAGELPRFEYALSAASLLADVAVHSDDRVGAMVFDDEVRAFVAPTRGAGALQRMRDAFVPVRATMRESDYALAFRSLTASHRKRSLLVIFTDVIDPRASQSLIAYTVRSAARHLPLVVALRNEPLERAALPTDHSAAGLFTSASAEELVLARSEALRWMRRAGISVLDVAPQQMAAAVVNRYLEVKARGSL